MRKFQFTQEAFGTFNIEVVSSDLFRSFLAIRQYGLIMNNIILIHPY